MNARKTVAVAATDAGMRSATDAFEAFVASQGVPARTCRRFLLALDEILSNIIRHGRPQGSVTINVTFSMQGDQIEVELIDTAGAFNPLQVSAPDTAAPLDARQPGGLGIALVRAMMDDVRYERRDERNILTLTARLPARADGESDHADS